MKNSNVPFNEIEIQDEKILTGLLTIEIIKISPYTSETKCKAQKKLCPVHLHFKIYNCNNYLLCKN